MPVLACWVARADLRNAFSPEAASPVVISEAGEHGTARLEEVAVEVADQRIAAPARPDFGKGKGAEHPNGNVPAERVVPAGRAVPAVGGPGRSPEWWKARPVGWTESARPGAMHCSCRGSLGAQRRTGRSVPPSCSPAISGAVSSATSDRSPSGSSRRVVRAGGGEGSLQRPAEGAERGLRRPDPADPPGRR